MTLFERIPAARFTLPVGSLLVAVGVWWLAVIILEVPPYLLPSPSAVAARIAGNPALYLQNTVATIKKVLVGGAIGIGSGFVIALAITYVPWLRRALYPYLVTVRVLPKVAIAPVLLIYIGTGIETAVLFVAVIAFFPMVVSTTAGLERVPNRYLDMLRTVRAGPLQTLLTVRLPYALPDVFAGLKQSITLAIIGAVVAEWVVSTEGLGFLVLFASEDVQTDVVFAAVVLLFAVGLLFYGAVVGLQRSLFWRFVER